MKVLKKVYALRQKVAVGSVLPTTWGFQKPPIARICPKTTNPARMASSRIR